LAGVEEDDKYTGAYVFPPTPGLYDMVVSQDFSSLYPSIIIAYNLDYTTMVLDPSIPDERCHVFEWWDHQFCSHDTTIRKTKTKGTVICKERRFRFLKEPAGVIPTILKNLLDARKNTRKEIKKLEQQVKEDKTLTSEQIEDLERMIVVLDKRQLSYKVTGNSLYGAMGVKKGYLPFFPGAMTTTYIGRTSIEKAAKWIQETHKVKLVYGYVFLYLFILF
jgi:DNA polymerase elongation subunit (family B)